MKRLPVAACLLFSVVVSEAALAQAKRGLRRVVGRGRQVLACFQAWAALTLDTRRRSHLRDLTGEGRTGADIAAHMARDVKLIKRSAVPSALTAACWLTCRQCWQGWARES